jgi:5-carboxymethyl-2-hydroxymuconate isomerase
MPYFVLDCSRGIDRYADPDEILKSVHDAADSTGLFQKGKVKVSLNQFEHYTVGGTRDDFIHVIGYIWTGRSEEQRSDLSRQIARALKTLLPAVFSISVDIRQIERATYNNRDTV